MLESRIFMITHLVLASNSPRRKELLSLTAQAFDVAPADINEDPQEDEEPAAYVSRLAREKARAAAEGLSGQAAVLLAADTTVVHEGRILGKPADQAEAVRMLQELRGKEHTVYTAITVLDTASGQESSDLAGTQVPMRDYSDAEIREYVASGDPMDKAGSYAIQHSGFHPVDELPGCWANVMGLPLCHLKRTVEKMGFTFDVDLPAACQQHLAYDCPVTGDILEWRQ